MAGQREEGRKGGGPPQLAQHTLQPVLASLAPWDIPIFSIVYIFRQSFLGLFSLAQYRPQPYRLCFVLVGGGREEEEKAASTSRHTVPRRVIVRKRCIFYDLQQLFGGTKHYEIFFAA